MNAIHIRGRLLSALLALCLVCGAMGMLTSCGQDSEAPDGYQDATCRGEYFRLYVPTQWTVNTESGVSGAYISALDETAVSMAEVYVAGADETGTVVASLEDFLAAHLASIEALDGYTADKTPVDSAMNGYRAKELYFTAKVGEKTYRYRQVLTRVENRFYLFTYSSITESFDRWLDIVDGILENILFYGQPYEGGEHEKKIPDVDNMPDGMKLVSTNDVAYRFFAPADWVEIPGSAASQVCASETDRSNVSVIGYVPDTEGFSVSDYWEMTEEGYRSALTDYTLISTTTEGQTMGGRDATVYEYTYSLGGVTYHARQVVAVYSYMIVTMTYTALPEQYDTHMEDVLAMQAALTFRKPIVG